MSECGRVVVLHRIKSCFLDFSLFSTMLFSFSGIVATRVYNVAKLIDEAVLSEHLHTVIIPKVKEVRIDPILTNGNSLTRNCQSCHRPIASVLLCSCLL